MSVVRDFCGHGLGRLFHDEPNIVHVGRPGEGIVLKPGMFFTVEPMINLGRPHVKVLSDGWTAVTRDRSLSAQFEHTVGVTDERRRDLHALAGRTRQAALHEALIAPVRQSFRSDRTRVHPMRLGSGGHWLPMAFKSSCNERTSAGLAEAPPHYHGHRERLRARFREAGSDAVTDYELLELVLFRAIPQRDVKPLAKELIAKFGSFAEVIAAPPAAARGDQGHRAKPPSPNSRSCTRRRAGSRAGR